MHFVLVKGHIKHDMNGFCPIAFALRLRIGNDDGKVGLPPWEKHAEQAGFAYGIAVQIGDGEPDRIFRLMIHGDTGFHLFFVDRLFKAALKHDSGLTEPMGEKRSVFLPLLPQNDPFSSDFFFHMLS